MRHWLAGRLLLDLAWLLLGFGSADRQGGVGAGAEVQRCRDARAHESELWCNLSWIATSAVLLTVIQTLHGKSELHLSSSRILVLIEWDFLMVYCDVSVFFSFVAQAFPSGRISSPIDNNPSASHLATLQVCDMPDHVCNVTDFS